MKQEKILVINPATRPGMTERIAATLEPFRTSGVRIACETAPGGPRLIASDADIDAAAVALRAHIADVEAAVIVIACYGDPGLQACREAAKAPVLGVGRCAALAALARADTFGVVAMSAASIPRHKRALRQAGLDALLAGERPLPPGGSDDEAMFERLCAAGRELRDEDGAGAVVIGCAEFGGLRGRLEAALGVPVVDPVAAAMAFAAAIVASH
jgi:Asp/Glu/hydantoin racemase